MTIQEAISRADSLQPNSYTTAQKIEWLSELDKDVYWRMLRNARLHPVYKMTEYNTDDQVHFKGKPYVCLADGVDKSPLESPDDWQEETFDGYASAVDQTTELLAPVPYDMPLYLNWLLMQMDLYSREIDQYNNRTILFNAAWDDLQRYVIRKYYPIQEVTHFRL